MLSFVCSAKHALKTSGCRLLVGVPSVLFMIYELLALRSEAALRPARRSRGAIRLMRTSAQSL
jgi:hypothetical protein